MLKTPPLLILLLLLVLSACSEVNEKKTAGKFGMMDENTPDYAALQFFDGIYRGKDISGALKLSSPKMGRLLQSYRTNRNVQRHVFNMPYDTVEFKPHAVSAGRKEFAKEAQVRLFFEGEINGNILKDLRVVKLVRPGKKWLVDEVSLN
ncbi:MAG: hypothetical protein ACI965_001966 [Paraglaciecola sp.]|jgi:hypothetical protein